jgi:hypothetical protein
MALKPCKECGREISTDAKSCPHCGKNYNLWRGPLNLIAILIGFALALIVFWLTQRYWRLF